MSGSLVRRASSNLALVVAGVLVALLLAELAIRLVGLPAQFGRLISLYGLERRETDGVVLWDSHELEQRYGDEDLARFERASDAVKIVGLGDSIMFGVGQPAEATYLAHASRLLSERSPRPVEILNLAIPGYNTAQENAVHAEISDRLRPDVVLVHYWADDSRQYRFFGGYIVDFGDMLEDGGRIQALPLPSSVNDWLLVHSKLYALLTHWVVVNRSQPQAARFSNAARPMLEIHRRAQAAGARLIVLASPGLEREQPDPNTDLHALRELGAREGFEVIDLTKWLHGIDSHEVAMDSCHFNAEGHRILGEKLAEYLLGSGLLDEADSQRARLAR